MNKDLYHKENYEDNFFVKIDDEMVRGNCPNGTFYEADENDGFDVHFLAGFNNKCGKRELHGTEKLTQKINLGMFQI